MDIAQLGVTKQELLDLVVNKIASTFLGAEPEERDEEGNPFNIEARLDSEIGKRITKKIAAAVDRVCEKHFSAAMEEKIESLIVSTSFPSTNEYGEQKPGSVPMTLREMLADRAKKYLEQRVDENGKPRPKDSYGWRDSQTMAQHLVGKEINAVISTAVRDTVVQGNLLLADTIEKAIKSRFDEVRSKLSIKVMESQ